MTSSGLAVDGVEDESNNGEHGLFGLIPWWVVIVAVVVLVVVAVAGIAMAGSKFSEVEFG